MSWRWLEVKGQPEKKLHVPSRTVNVPMCGSASGGGWG